MQRPRFRTIGFALAALATAAMAIVAMRSRSGPERAGPGKAARTGAGMIVQRRDAALGARLEGTVRDPSGVPVAGARVRWIGWNGKALAPLATVRTGPEGAFSFSGADQRIQRGGALVCDTDSGAVGVSTRRMWGGGTGAFAPIAEGVRIEIPFVGTNGDAMSDLLVRVERYIPTLGWMLETTLATDRSGLLSAGPFERGAFVRIAVPSKYAQPIRLDLLAAGTDPVKRLRPVRLLPAGRIEGRVVDVRGRPVSGVALRAEPGEVGFASGGDAPPAGVRVVRTDSAGRYVFSGLPPSPHRVCIDAAHGEAARGWLPACQSVVSRSGAISPMPDLVARRGSVVAGRCVDAGSGEPVGGATVWLLAPGAQPPVVEPLTSSSVFAGSRRGAGAGTLLKPVTTPGNSVATLPDGSFALCVPVGKWSVRPTKIERSTLIAGDFTPEVATAKVAVGATAWTEFTFRRRGAQRTGGRMLRGFEEAR